MVGGVLAFVLRTWLVKLSQSQLESRYAPLMHALADADALTAHCRGLVDAAFKEERKKIAARRDDELKRIEETYRKAFAAAEAHRDEKLRKINEVYASAWSRCRRRSSATCARPSTSTTAVWPSCASRSRPAAQARREVQSAQGAVGDEPRNGLERDGRSLARRDEGRGRRA